METMMIFVKNTHPIMKQPVKAFFPAYKSLLFEKMNSKAYSISHFLPSSSISWMKSNLLSRLTY